MRALRWTDTNVGASHPRRLPVCTLWRASQHQGPRRGTRQDKTVTSVQPAWLIGRSLPAREVLDLSWAATAKQDTAGFEWGSDSSGKAGPLERVSGAGRPVQEAGGRRQAAGGAAVVNWAGWAAVDGPGLPVPGRHSSAARAALGCASFPHPTVKKLSDGSLRYQRRCWQACQPGLASWRGPGCCDTPSTGLPGRPQLRRRGWPVRRRAPHGCPVPEEELQRVRRA